MTYLVDNEGITSFKLFMAYPGVFYSDDGQILRAMQNAGESGAMIMMHAENGIAIDVLVGQALARGETDPKYHSLHPAGRARGRGHPPGDPAGQGRRQRAAVHRPHVGVGGARGGRRGPPPRPERVRRDVPAVPLPVARGPRSPSPASRAPSGCARRRCARSTSTTSADLWKGLRMNELAVVSTDHCPFCMKDQKELGLGNFSKIPNGIGGVEHRMELLYQGVVTGEITLERWVETCCTTPARMFGMYPTKGVIAPGADADIVVWDPNGHTSIGIDKKHHMNMDHSAWEGFEIDGKVDTVLSRGTRRRRERHVHRAPRATASTSSAACRSTSSSEIEEAHDMNTDLALDRRHGRRGDVRALRRGVQPGDRGAGGERRLRQRRRGRRRRRRRQGGVPGVAGDRASARRAEVMFHIRELVDANRKEIASLLTAEHGKVLVRRPRRGRPRPREHRVRLRHPAPAEGRLQRAGGDRRRRLLDPPAARRRRRHHAVQLPGDGADVDVRQRPGVRQHVRAQAEREGPVGVAAARRAARQGRAAAGLLQRRAGRQGRRRPAPRAPRHRRRQLRRLDADRQVHLRDGHGERQAGAGARRGQEPHARAARRRPRHGRRRRRVGRLRLGRRAVHGDQRRARRRLDRRRARRQDRRADPVDQGRSGHRARQRDGPADHRRAPRQGARLRRRRGRRTGRPSSSTGATALPAEGFFLKPTLLDNVDAGHDGLRRRDLRPGAVASTRVHAYDEGARADQRQPVRQRHRDLHPRRRRRPPVPVRRQRRHGRRQRADPGAGQLLQLRRVEGQPVRRHAHVRPGGHQLLHPRQGRHQPLARPVDSTIDLGFPQNR